MKIEAVLVSCTLSKSQSFNESSGILINENVVLLSGTILIPFLNDTENKKWVASFVESSSSNLETNKHILKALFRVFKEAKESNEANQVDSRKLLFHESKAVGVWKCPLVTHSLEKLFYDWTLGHVTDNDFRGQFAGDIDMSKELMSIFIILKWEGGVQNKEKDDVHDLFNLVSALELPNRGQEVELVSTPFGNRLFLNSISRGIVSNVIGTEKCIILTDARTVSGCEGGPIFALNVSRDKKKKKGKLIGLVTCALTWWRGEWVGLTIGITLLPVLRKLLRVQVNYTDHVSIKTLAGNIPGVNYLQSIDKTVVLIRSENSWGSGVVLDAASGTVITCSHVLKSSDNVSVFYKSKHFPADVIFKSKPDVAYDLAVIKIQDGVFEKAIEYTKTPARIGRLSVSEFEKEKCRETVFAAGFPFFSERDQFNLQPSLVCGCVARANSFMIQTTCCIQSGFSGGPILREGKLLGIIISNTKDSSSGALYPHINFVIPSRVFQKPVESYLKTKNRKHLEALEVSNTKIQSLWALECSKL